MPGNVKGITITFAGDTTKLDKALREVRNSTKGIDKELSQVNRALKFNPKNVELLAQKQELLKQKVTQTEKSLKDLRPSLLGVLKGAARPASACDPASPTPPTPQFPITATWRSKLRRSRTC